jgi:hypothetical protein
MPPGGWQGTIRPSLPCLQDEQILMHTRSMMGFCCEPECCAAWLGWHPSYFFCSSSSWELMSAMCLEGTPVLCTTFLHPEWRHDYPALNDSCGRRDNSCTLKERMLEWSDERLSAEQIDVHEPLGCFFWLFDHRMCVLHINSFAHAPGAQTFQDTSDWAPIMTRSHFGAIYQ